MTETKRSWNISKPPNEQIVEAIHVDSKQVLRVKAFYGRDGYRPHWESEDGNVHYSADSFVYWREVASHG